MDEKPCTNYGTVAVPYELNMPITCFLYSKFTAMFAVQLVAVSMKA